MTASPTGVPWCPPSPVRPPRSPRWTPRPSPRPSSPLRSADAAKAANTRRAYAADLADFRRWAASRGASPLPCPPGLVCGYLACLPRHVDRAARPRADRPRLRRRVPPRRVARPRSRRPEPSRPMGCAWFIRRSKTDPEFQGQEVAIPRGSQLRPVETLQAYPPPRASAMARCFARLARAAPSAPRRSAPTAAQAPRRRRRPRSRLCRPLAARRLFDQRRRFRCRCAEDGGGVAP
jgi:hypothetical protein